MTDIHRISTFLPVFLTRSLEGEEAFSYYLAGRRGCVKQFLEGGLHEDVQLVFQMLGSTFEVRDSS